jgi:tetratricopeptide (TPR) repeat protein
MKPMNNGHSPRDFDVNDENFSDVLKTLQGEAIIKINEGLFIEAIADLMHSEEILESVAAKGELTDIDEVLVLLNNMALCYQRIGEVDKAIAYLEGALYNFRFFMNKPSLKNDIKMNALLAKINLQCCAMFSQKGQHKEALKYAKTAEMMIENSLNCLIKAHSRYYLKAKTDSKKFPVKVKKISSKSSQSALKILEDYLSTGRLQIKKKIKSPDWSKQIAIADIMLIQLTSLSHFKEDFSLSEELSLDSIIYKVILLSVAHYCIATETNYIKLSNAFIEVTENSIEIEYQESLSLLTCFTSSTSKIVNHVNEGFFKNCMKTSLEKEVKNLRVRKTCVTPVPGDSKTILNSRKVSIRQPRRGKSSCVDFDL